MLIFRETCYCKNNTRGTKRDLFHGSKSNVLLILHDLKFTWRVANNRRYLVEPVINIEDTDSSDYEYFFSFYRKIFEH